VDSFLLPFEFILCDVFHVELVKMRESAVPAPDCKMPAANSQVVGTGHMAVPAFRGFKKIPEIVTPDLCKGPRQRDILNAGNKDPGCPAIITRNFRFVRNCFNNLVCDLTAMVTVSTEFCENEPFIHGKYWTCPGSLICCTSKTEPRRQFRR
jgi:hypothetical protein